MGAMVDVDSLVSELRSSLQAVAVTADAGPMRAYMRDQFEFLGIKSAPRRAAAKATLAAGRSLSVDDLLALADSCWLQDEREFQYVGADVLVANSARIGLEHMPSVVRLVASKSWWDTVDVLGPRVIGAIVRDEPAGWIQVDAWIDDENFWLARCAILQQLHYGSETDSAVLFDRCLRRAADPEFFIRKAIGWSLRQHARFEPDAVRSFVARHSERLSPLSVREATKHL